MITKMHKPLLALVLLTAFAVTGWTYMKESTRYAFSTESKMWVEGTSTLHDWKAQVKSVSGTFEVAGGAGLLEGGMLSAGQLTIPVANLDCENGTMNKKMFEALKADAHKTITFQLASAKLMGTPSGQAFQVLAKGKLTLAGVQKPVEVTLSGQDLGGGKLRLKGSYPLLMSDFSIKPPSAMMGTIKTGDKVTVHFELVAAEEPAI